MITAIIAAPIIEYSSLLSLKVAPVGLWTRYCCVVKHADLGVRCSPSGSQSADSLPRVADRPIGRRVLSPRFISAFRPSTRRRGRGVEPQHPPDCTHHLSTRPPLFMGLGLGRSYCRASTHLTFRSSRPAGGRRECEGERCRLPMLIIPRHRAPRFAAHAS